ncbi:hypothetical protein [Bradyrhizobium sp. MOS002]|nr:hypothetical protein [Bradyrhizobium sp. MOS002]
MARAIRAAVKGGLVIDRVEIEKSGKIVVVPKSVAAPVMTRAEA